MARILLLDSYDSFTYNLKDYLERTGADVSVVTNDQIPIEEIDPNSFDGAVLSPGPQTPEKSGILMPFIERFIGDKPLLGVCLGHQAIGIHFGLPLVKMDVPVHGKVSRLNHKEHQMFEGISGGFEVCRYHSLILSNVYHPELEVTATTENNQVMAVSHKHLPVWGFQFHPEAILTEYGLQLITNWHNLVKLNLA